MVHQEVVTQHSEEVLDLETFQQLFLLKVMMPVKPLNQPLVAVEVVELDKEMREVQEDKAIY
jgi:hypothetical protein